jgi:transcriptional regulator with XRE-family HTH domain
MIDIGHRIRQLRIKNDLTLEELASRTELTKGFLSQLERNLTSPSLQTLEDICEALGVSMSRFFADEKEEQIVFREEDVFVDERKDQVLHWIVPNAQKNRMEPLLLEMEPGAESMHIDPHEGEEMGYVLSGRVTLCFSNHEKGQTVKKGETFYMTGNEAHWLCNRSHQKAAVLWISTPPVF